jgi:hypothetical protein
MQEVLTSERVARILADYAIEVRKLAYILSSVGLTLMVDT